MSVLELGQCSRHVLRQDSYRNFTPLLSIRTPRSKFGTFSTEHAQDVRLEKRCSSYPASDGIWPQKWDGGEGSNSRKIYLVYRYSSALYFAAWLLVSWSSFWDRAKWFIYLTHWAFACLVLDQSLQTLLLLLNGSLLPLPVSGATGTYKTLWVVGNVSSAMALSVTFGFWVFLYDGSKPLSAITLHTHGVNAVFVLVDTLVSARPCRLAHAFHPVLASLCYVSFTGVYWLLGGRGKDETPYVYPVLNWTHGARTLGRALGLCFVGVTAMHVPRWAVTKCRDAFFRRRRRLPTGMSSPGTVKV